MAYATTVRAERFVFDNLSVVFAKANEEKSGDQLAGIAATSEQERVAAKLVLADLSLSEIADNPLIDAARGFYFTPRRESLPLEKNTPEGLTN